MSVDLWKFPRVVHVPSREGRKPVSIPDITQFAMITRSLFGVGCRAPTEVYASGTYNELFLLELDLPAEHSLLPRIVLARVARDLKTRSDISLESEVATMVFVRQECPSVPVPTVYGYCPIRDNAIGLPFSIISFTEGVDMHGVPWEDLPLDLKLAGVRDFAKIVSQLSQLQFKAIGSIYFKFSDAPRCQIPAGFVLGPASWAKEESAARAAAFQHDRGPWKSAGAWLRASLNDEVQFVDALPVLAKETFALRNNREKRWRLAQRVLPQMRDRVPDVRDDLFDQCATGPFVLGHMDLNPWNMIFCPSGPNAGRIVSVIDWEMSLTVPLWRMVCHPLWFDRTGTGKVRDRIEAQCFKDAYIRELQKYARESIVLRVVQNAQYEARRRFAEIAVLGWDSAEIMDRWLEQHPLPRHK